MRDPHDGLGGVFPVVMLNLIEINGVVMDSRDTAHLGKVLDIFVYRLKSVDPANLGIELDA